MKKLLAALISISLVTTNALYVVSCNIGDINGAKWLSNLPDYKWEEDNFGDRMESENYLLPDKNYGGNKTKQNSNLINKGSYIDYSKFSTGYQWQTAIEKQAVTGVPTNRIFMPNGNKISDFGISSKAQKYKTINEVLDWDPKKDMDAKYNKSGIKKKISKPVATKSVDSQNDKIQSNLLQFTSYFHRSATNTNVGLRNPQDNNFNQWQYVDNYVDWGGSYYEGVIKIPGSDFIDAAHVNGTNAFGTIFLDGYHGLSKRMIKKMFKKDEYGKYLLPKKILEMSLYYGIDGFYWNNEPNGSLPNGAILDYHDVYEVIEQFNELKNKSSDPNAKNLKIIYYNNGSQLGSSNPNNEHNMEGETMSKVVDVISDNFNTTANELRHFIAKNPKYQNDNKFNITTISSLTANGLDGVFDTRNMTDIHYDENLAEYGSDSKQEQSDRMDRKWRYRDPKDSNNKDAGSQNSFSFYQDNGGASFGEVAYNDAINSKEFKKGKITKLEAELYGQQVSHIFNQMTYTGRNRILKGASYGKDDINDKTKDHGYFTGLKEYIDYKDIYSNMDIFTANKYKEKSDHESLKKDSDGNFIMSFGAGNIKTPRTVITDENPELLTNFSTGSGGSFVSKDGLRVDNYPWTNKHLTDVQPTYNSDIKIYEQGKNENELINVAQNKGSGFYDYYNIYKKGNSIALAESLNIDGSLNGMKFESGKQYLWNVMGTNLTKPNLKTKFTLKGFKDLDIKVVSIDENNKVTELSTSSKPIGEDWTEYQADINSSNTVGKISLLIKPRKEVKTILNIGEFKISKFNSKKNDIDISQKQTDLNIEYLINRTNETFVRFNWKNDSLVKPDWYEIYVKDEKGNIYRAGESVDELYFIRKIRFKGNFEIGIKPVINYSKDNLDIDWFEVKNG